MGVNHYPLELREQVLTEYELWLGGYRKLAKRHGLKRDTVRDWVKTYGSKGDQMKKNKVKTRKKNIKEMSREELEEQLELSMLAADFWEFYANELKEQIKEESKKKAQLKVSENTANKKD
jgi:transposase